MDKGNESKFAKSFNAIDSLGKEDEAKFVDSFNDIDLFEAFSNRGARYVPAAAANILSEKEARAINADSTPVKPMSLRTTTGFPTDRRPKQRELSTAHDDVLEE